MLEARCVTCEKIAEPDADGRILHVVSVGFVCNRGCARQAQLGALVAQQEWWKTLVEEVKTRRFDILNRLTEGGAYL